MQLKRKSPRSVRGPLALATCGLLAGTAHAADTSDTLDPAFGRFGSGHWSRGLSMT